MKRLGIAMLLVVIALSGVRAALAYDSPPTTDPDPIETPQRERAGILLLLALVTLSGVGTASAYNDDPPVSGPDAVQAP